MVYAPLAYVLSPSGLLSYENSDIGWDYAIGGIPFFGAQSKDRPMTRKTADYRKEQPTEPGNIPDPGQISIQAWWLKAQSTFHAGTDQLYMDTPTAQSATVKPLRYQDSEGVDIWTAGQVTLLNETYQLGADIEGGVTGLFTTDKYVFASNEHYVYRYDLSGNRTVMWHHTDTATVFSTCTNGLNWFAYTRQGVYKGSIDTPGVTKIYNGIANSSFGGIHWIKDRLIVTSLSPTSSPVYELSPNPVGAPIDLPTPIYVHPEIGWEWWGATDAPGAILVGGGTESTSTIFKFTLYQDGSTPHLTAGAVAAELPRGERVWNMASYLGSMIGLSTSRGLRIGQFTGQGGDFELGPVSVPFFGAARHVSTGYSRFVYTTYDRSDGTTGLARVDLSQQLSIRQFNYVPDQRFAWAPDLLAMDGSGDPMHGFTAGGVVSIGDRLVFNVRGKGIFIQNLNRYVKSGYLESSRIRFGTDDPKVFRYIRVQGEGEGSIDVAVAAGDRAFVNVGGTDLPDHRDSGDLLISGPPANYATVKLTLTRGQAHKMPTCFGYQLKALCAQKRQRLIQLPLSCFDFESDGDGQKAGGASTAYPRLRALEAIEEAGDITTYQTISPYSDQAETRLVTIDALQFMQTSIPSDEQGWGGYLMVTLRTVD